MSILPVSTKRPLNCEDMNLNPSQEYISTEVIMDGRVLGENLKRMGLDEIWLKKQLKSQGCSAFEDVFLAVCDENKKLTVYSGE